MSFAFLPLYTGDYLRDTRHLSPLKHGIYMLLLMHCWDQKGPLPLDSQECAGIANCRSTDELDALRYILGRFFVRMEDGLYNTRMQAEIERANAISNKRKAAGAKGYQAKAKHLRSKSQASGTTLTPTPTTTTTPTATPTKTHQPTAGCPPTASEDRVPYQEIVSAYHELLPACPKVVALSDTRKGYIRARWKAGQLPDIATWREFFAYVAKSKFLTGQVEGRGDRPPFIADLEWLCKEGNFLKVWEGKFHREQVQSPRRVAS